MHALPKLKNALSLGLVALLACHRPPAAPAPRRPPPDAARPARVADDPAVPFAEIEPGVAHLPGEYQADVTFNALVDGTAPRVSRVRHLPLLRPVERSMLSAEGVRARIAARFHDEYAPGELALAGELYQRLGMIPEGTNYERTLLEVAQEQGAGFYDPALGRLFLASWMAPSMQLVTLSHELVHVLQDQHFSIARLLRHRRGEGDAQAAAAAVVEGDAALAGLEDLLRASGRSLSGAPEMLSASLPMTIDPQAYPRLAAAPPVMQQELSFPYREGFALCARLWRANGFAPIDTLLRSPPASTEQVLHADKLDNHEAPFEVSPRFAMLGLHLAYDDVLGELGLRLFLGTALSSDVVVNAAAGWGGDRAMLFLPDGAPAGSMAGSALVWRLVFDAGFDTRREGEAVEFERAAERVLAHRYPNAITVRTQQGRTRRAYSLPGERVSAVVRRGREVLLFDRVPRTVLEDVDGVP